MPKHADIAAELALGALGNRVRRDIVRLLRARPLSVGEIAENLPVTRPAVSKHLRVLERAAIVAYDRRGTRNVFRLDPRGFELARRWLDAFWDETLARFALVAENVPPRGDEK